MNTQKETRTSAIRETGAGSSTTYMERRSTPDSSGATAVPRLSAVDISDAMPLFIVIAKTPADRISRRCYLSLHAAEKAAKRARARGSAVSLELRAVVRAEAVGTDG